MNNWRKSGIPASNSHAKSSYLAATMEALRQEIKELLCMSETGHDGDPTKAQFVPLESLHRLLSPEKIQEAVNGIGEIDFYLQQSTVDWIMEHGWRIFAILIVLESNEAEISKFMRYDIFDEKLPITDDVLRTIVPDIASGFYEQQWAFIAPKLVKGVIHRILHPNHRLPFIHNKKFDSGGFGDIYEVVIHPDHQNISLLPKENVSANSWHSISPVDLICLGARHCSERIQSASEKARLC